MITANQIHARRAQQQFQAFCGKWADAYGVACVKNRVDTLAPNCSQGNLKCGQVAVDICQDRIFMFLPGPYFLMHQTFQ